MAKICGIYKITSPSGRIYIGQSIHIRNRFNSYKKLNCKAQTALYRSLVKHGAESHLFEIIKECERCDLNYWEDYYIKQFDSFNTKKGLNLHSGGNSHVASDETKRKLSLALTGRKHAPMKPELKKHFADLAKKRWQNKEYRDAVSSGKKGLLPWNTGGNHSEETKNKIAKSRTRPIENVNGINLYSCSGCGCFLPKESFYKHKRNILGITHLCKPCFIQDRKNQKINFTELNK